jgi:hypothetical protein
MLNNFIWRKIKMIKELKKELSALSGVDFFNPKYREVFKRYFPNDTEEVTAEEEKLAEMVEEPIVEPAEVVEEKAEEIVEDKTEEVEQQEEVAEAEAVEEVVEETNQDTIEATEEVKEELSDDIQESEEKAEDKIDDHAELVDAKIELELVKAGVREDRLEPAKKLLMSEVTSVADVEKVKDLIKAYPEWIKREKTIAKPFGMSLDDNGEGLTEEEKRLKIMGINPR